MIKKSRNISKEDYFKIVQLEWLSYKTRELLYEREFDKKMYSNICDMKKEKIDTYAFRHGQKSIFTSGTIRDKFLNIFAGTSGFPSFEYKDDNHREKIGYWDKYFCFKEGTNVIIDNKPFPIVENIIGSNQVIINVNGNRTKMYYCDCVTLIKELLKNNIVVENQNFIR